MKTAPIIFGGDLNFQTTKEHNGALDEWNKKLSKTLSNPYGKLPPKYHSANWRCFPTHGLDRKDSPKPFDHIWVHPNFYCGDPEIGFDEVFSKLSDHCWIQVVVHEKKKH